MARPLKVSEKEDTASQANELKTTYHEAMKALVEDRPHQAYGILYPILQAHPRATQSLYLLGISALLSGRGDFGTACIDRAYKIKPWIKDDVSFLPQFSTLVEESRKRGHVWGTYIDRRARFQTVGFDYDSLILELVQRKKDIRFCEVGANDGVSDDPLHKWIVEYGFSGLLIEPQPEVFKRLKNNYRGNGNLLFENCAVGNETGELVLHLSHDRDEEGVLASAVPDRNALKGKKTRTITAPVDTLENILKRHGMARLDILQIDTEGFEWKIISKLDLAALDLSIIHAEFYCLPLEERVAMMRYISRAGFIYHFDGMNLTACKVKRFRNVVVSDSWKERKAGTARSSATGETA